METAFVNRDARTFLLKWKILERLTMLCVIPELVTSVMRFRYSSHWISLISAKWTSPLITTRLTEMI